MTRVFDAFARAAAYCLLPEAGLRSASAQDRHGLDGVHWLALHSALDDEARLTATLRLCAQWPADVRQSLQGQLRQLLHYHCGVQTLRTRQVWKDLQAL